MIRPHHAPAAAALPQSLIIVRRAKSANPDTRDIYTSLEERIRRFEVLRIDIRSLDFICPKSLVPRPRSHPHSFDAAAMSWFSCFSRRNFSPEDLDSPPRPIRNIAYESRVSTSQRRGTSTNEKGCEIVEMTMVEKEVGLLEYDSDEDDEVLQMDLEKEFHMEARLVRRGVLPSRFKKQRGSHFLLSHVRKQR